MEQPPPKQGLFSSLTLGRASRSSKPPANASPGTNANTNEPLTHPLLAASTSSLNIPTTSDNTPDLPSTIQQSGHKSSGSTSSRSGAGNGTGTGTGSAADLTNLPYKPRQRHGGGIGSAGSAASIFGAPSSAAIATTSTSTASPTLVPTPSSVSTSPVTPTIVPSGPPTTSTSTSTATFALPPSTSDSSLQADYSAQSITVNANTSGTGTGQAHAHTSASLTSRLQLQSLKAAAQKIGLGNGSMGMSMIDAIFEKGQQGRAKAGEGGEWGDLLRILMGGKAILLLPTTPSSSLPMTPQTLRDHIGFISPPVPLASSSSTSKLPGHASSAEELEKDALEINTHVLVTLSGLVGTLRGTSITFESTLPYDSPLLAALKDATTRQTVLSSLRPTETHASTSTPNVASFPSFTISPDTAVLPFPPPSKTPQPMASDIKEKEKPPPGKLGRINPFASLFGSSSAAPSPTLGSSPSSTQIAPPSPSIKAEATLTPERPLSPTRAHGGSRPSSPSPPSPRPSLLTIDHSDNASILSDTASVVLAHGEGYQVTAYTVARPIRYSETHKSLAKALRGHVKEVLNKLPDKVVDKVIKVVLANTCPSALGAGDDLLKGQKGNHQSDADIIATLDFSDPTTTGERLQDLMEGIYDDLISHYRHEIAEGLKRKSSGNVPWGRAHSNTQITEADKASTKEKREKDRLDKEEYAEKEASDGTERVEALICRLLYNRLFSPLESDDARHDEALASRIAALNMLDLSLDHLGLITRPADEKPEGAIASGLSDIVDKIGDELQKLSSSSCLTPKDKAEVLIRAHKIVVDGLAEMPNVELRPEGEPYRPDEPPSESALPSSVETELPTIHTPDNQSSRSSPSLHPLALENKPEPRSSSSSPAASDASDPLTAIASRTTPSVIPSLNRSPSVPQLVLSDSADESTESTRLKEAMSDSVMTITGNVQSEPLSRETSASTAATSSSASSVPPPRPPSNSASKQRTSGADLILPIIIYSVVKSNPPQLASQLMYLRRYRSAICLTGEASYAIVNLTAVVEFIEHVDLAELGLGGESDKVMSIDDLSPIGLNYLDESNADAASIASASSRLRGRVFQVGEMAGTAAGSANKVISGVVDSSWTALRGLISTGANANPNVENEAATAATSEGSTSAASGEAGSRPGLRPRQASTFSLASVTASVASIAAAAAARNRSRANSRASAPEHVWSGNQELQEVTSRPASVRERGDKESVYEISDDADEDGDDSESEGGEDNTGPGYGRRHGRMRSTNSAVSTSNSNSKSSAILGKDDQPKERVSLSNRLASIGVLGRLSQPSSSGTPPQAGALSTSASSSPIPMPATSLPKVMSSDSLGGGPAELAGGDGSVTSKPSNFLANLTQPRSVSLSSPSSSSDKLPSHTYPQGQGHGRRSSLLGGLEAVLKGNSNHSTPSPRGHLTSLPLSNEASTGSGPGAGEEVTGYTVPIDNEPPIDRFMHCEVGDIRLSEIGVLLRDYRRLGHIVASAQREQQQQQVQHQQTEHATPQL
ncbi:guanyl-nucleotide exchange factor [Kwoniella heveanensis CBS 569]|nr:guanyl-nucleotide exchange factor [Kwoniella heveanensis CBS 569]